MLTHLSPLPRFARSLCTTPAALVRPLPTQPQVGVAVHIYPRLPCGRVDPRWLLLIQRGSAPGKGLWVFPGGRQELGETIAAAAAREALEEVGLQVGILDHACPVFTATDVLHVEAGAGLTYHYAILHVLATVGVPVDAEGRALLPAVRARDDAVDAAWVDVVALAPAGGGPGRPRVARGAPGRVVEDIHSLQRRGILVPLSIEVATLAGRQWGMRGVPVVREAQEAWGVHAWGIGSPKAGGGESGEG